MATTNSRGPGNAEAVNHTATNPSAKTGAGICCYIGPNIHGVIQTSTIYPGSKAEVLKRPEVALAISKQPRIADLIVSGSDLAEARVKVHTPGEALAKAYKALADAK